MALVVLGAVGLTWFTLRQPETLLPESRIPFSIRRIVKGAREVCTNRVALGYTLAMGFILGAFVGYLNSAQQIFQEVYGLGRHFPFYMGFLALMLGSAAFANSRIVMRLGMRWLSYRAMLLFIILTALYLFTIYQMGGSSSLLLFMVCFSMAFFCLGILFGNMNAIAMEPLGHIAGMGAAVIGSLSNFISVPLAIIIGRYYNGTLLPLICGFVILGLFSMVAMGWADSLQQRKTVPSHPQISE